MESIEKPMTATEVLRRVKLQKEEDEKWQKEWNRKTFGPIIQRIYDIMVEKHLMEPPELSHEVRIIYTIKTKVKKIYPIDGKGWYVQFEGSTESICFGSERPIWSEGADVEITFRRVEK